MSLPESGSAVNEKRIVNISGGFSHSNRDSMRVFVGIADYEVLEIESRVEKLLLLERIAHP